MFAMHPDKISRPDGFNKDFYQKMWEDIGETVVAACREWLDKGDVPAKLQATTIVLLPKVAHPKQMTELQPISMCNVLYRLVAKVLANRLSESCPES
ncbi:LINE-1 retrotransposable element ORF2 protein [Linum grandiflorum]